MTDLAYDPHARGVSPGRLLLWLTIQRAIEYGVGLIDRGEGDKPHKRELATVNRPIRDTGSVTGRAYQGLEWRLRSLRRRPEPSGYAALTHMSIGMA